MTRTFKNHNGSNICITCNQTKKHVTQMNAGELVYLSKKIFEIKDDIKIKTDHLKNRVDVGDLPLWTFIKVIEEGKLPNKIIEYNETKRDGHVDHRVVIRDTKEETRYYHTGKEHLTYGQCNLCFVLSLDTGNIVTAYYNGVNDSHYTLDAKRYNENLKIIKEELFN